MGAAPAQVPLVQCVEDSLPGRQGILCEQAGDSHHDAIGAVAALRRLQVEERALHRAGLVNSPLSVDAADGLSTTDVRIVAAVRCAPPGNAPTPAERLTCSPWLEAEWRLVAPSVRVIVALGGFAWQAALRLLGVKVSAVTKFGHGAVAEPLTGLTLLGCYHPSQQNMFTGRLTPAMLDDVFATARRMTIERRRRSRDEECDR